jgi:hypothetical protein
MDQFGFAMSEAQQVWEEHYGERERVWSGRVNVRLAELVKPMTPGRALDLAQLLIILWRLACRWTTPRTLVLGVRFIEIAESASRH